MTEPDRTTDTELLSSRGFRPQPQEFDDLELVMSGSWPHDLCGSLYRNGPNPQFTPRGTYNPFLGDGMVHAFHIDRGQITYRNRWVRTQQWIQEHAADRALWATSGDPRDHDASVAGKPTDGVANTSMYWHAERLLCLEEGHAPIEIDPTTLETLGVWNFSDGLPSNFTAHPKLDPATGELIGFANYPRGQFNGELACYEIDSQGQIANTRSIKAPYPGLVHDFAVTERYIVFIICPLTISIPRAMTGGPPMAWEPDKPTYVGLLPRNSESREVTWFEHQAGFVWHVINAWDDEHAVTVDVCEQRAPAFPMPDGSMPPTSEHLTYPTRWTLSLKQTAEPRVAHDRRLADDNVEFPRIDERFTCTEHTHAYFGCGGGAGTPDMFLRAIGHLNYTTGDMDKFNVGLTSAVHEPVFIPRAADAAEGDGYLLTVVYDEEPDTSRLVLFDAQNVSGGPIATAQVNHRVPIGFHGMWLPR